MLAKAQALVPTTILPAKVAPSGDPAQKGQSREAEFAPRPVYCFQLEACRPGENREMRTLFEERQNVLALRKLVSAVEKCLELRQILFCRGKRQRKWRSS
jgi:hypothetical protein